MFKRLHQHHRSEISKVGAGCACHRDGWLRWAVPDVVLAIGERHSTIGDLPSVQASPKSAANVLRHVVDKETFCLVDVQRARTVD